MPTLRRRVAAVSALTATLAAGLAAPPATATHGPVVIDDHDSHVATRADHVESNLNGTLYTTDAVGDHGRNYLVAGALTTGSTPIDLGPGQWARVRPQLRETYVSVPVGASSADPVTTVRVCTVAVCPAWTTFTVPAGTQYVGSAGDRAVVWSAPGSDGIVQLVNWTTNAVTHTFTLAGNTSRPDLTEGDSVGLVLAAGGDVYYLARSGSAVTPLGFGNEARLTPTYAVWWAMGVGETAPFRTKVWRVLRSAPAAPPVETTLPGDPSIAALAANDAGFAYLSPNGDADGTSALWSAAWDEPPALYARPITTNSVASFEVSGDTTRFLVNDRLAGLPGLYAFLPGYASGSLTGLVPIRKARTHAVAASNGRAAYTDDMTADFPLFLRPVPNGSPHPETTLTTHTAGGALGLSGPFVVFTRPGTTATTVQVLFGPAGGPWTTRTFPAAEVGSVGISGRTVYLTNGSRGRLIDVRTNTVTDLGRSYVGVFGPYAVTLNYDTGEIRRRNLWTGATTVVRPAIAGCTTLCIDEERAQVAVWGNDVVYGFEADAGPATVAELWRGGTRFSLSMLTDGSAPRWYEFEYWAGVLLVSHVGGDVKTYDLNTFSGETLLDSDAERPLALDGHVAIWRPNDDLRAVVQDLTEIYPGYVASPRHLGSDAPAGFGPGVGTGTWWPWFFVSQDVDWTLEVRAGSVTGPVVHTAGGTSIAGLARPKPWDGTDERTGEPVAPGTYHWVLTGAVPGGGPSPVPLLPADGSTFTPISGTVYFSTAALGAPSLTAPVRSTDVSASTAFPISWTAPAGAPAGTTYRVERSVNGGAFGTLAGTSATTLTVSGSPGTTYRFRVRAVDPAGRLGALSSVKATMVPHDAGGTVGGTWTTVSGTSYYRGSQRRASAAGATWSFTATGTQLHLIGTKGTAYGRFYVSIDGGAYSPAVDTYSSTTRYRQVLFSRTGLSAGTHTVKIKLAGTSGRPYVGIDGIAYLR